MGFNDTLAHFGVKGMKWGVRRYQNKDGSLTPAGKKRYSKQDVSQMSDAELRQRINRIQMERQYDQLTKREKSFGEKFVKDVVTNAAKQTATNYVSKYLSKGVEEIIKKTLSR